MSILIGEDAEIKNENTINEDKETYDFTLNKILTSYGEPIGLIETVLLIFFVVLMETIPAFR